jgi:recombinational DNA repair protein (RecF pathway)
MYTIHRTDGFVLGSRAVGEASRDMLVLTRALGLVRARAQGVRLHASKLRGHLLLYSYGDFSFVRGREMWRLVGARSGGGAAGFAPAALRANANALAAFGRAAALLKRLLAGESPDPELFAVVLGMAGALSALPESAGAEAAERIEYLGLARILHRLGYLAPTPLFAEALGRAEWSEAAGAALSARRAEAIVAINESLAASQL